MRKIKLAIAVVIASAAAFLGITVSESIAPVADAVPVVDQADEASAEGIYRGGCGWEGTSNFAVGYCPDRVSWVNSPEVFRIRVFCVNSSNGLGGVEVFGPWRRGGNWTGSSVYCPAGKVRLSGSTYIQFA